MLLTTLGRQEDNQLNGIHIICGHYQLSLLVFHRVGGSINTSLKNRCPFSRDIPLADNILLNSGPKSLLLLLLCLCLYM